MDPKELRLGNYIHDRGGKVIKIDFIEHLQEGYNCKVGQKMLVEGQEVHPMTEYTDHAKPIPITDQWITKIGFKYNMFNWRLGEFRISKVDDRYNLGFKAQILVKNIKYVHQIQNIYFSLTNKQL